MKELPAMVAVIALGVGCGSAPLVSSERDTDVVRVDAGSDAGTAGGGDAARSPGKCGTADDCTAVLDYRTGFTCWFPAPASRSEVSSDPCLVAWNPNPRCSTPEPPADCPSGLMPVNHSCFSVPCVVPRCNEGTCSLDLGFGNDCPTMDAGAPDCAALLARYRNALAAAQECDPAQDNANCTGDYADGCGCEAPYKAMGPRANAVMCAFDAWRDPNCPVPSCGNACVTPTKAGATCVPNATGTMGTCAWKQ